ncbi:DAHP synthetase [Hypoxylon sp. FL1284]|nr:DAHP synthetase [Hypoxylon sp. FL1284]
MAPAVVPAQSADGPPSAAAPAWTPSSWRSKPIKQQAAYPDAAAVERATAELRRLPPIVHPHEIARLKASLRDVARGEAFLLQGGDCAELFDYCRADAVESKIKLLLQMSLVLIWGADKRVVRIGRMAGQYAKPRSSPTERVVVGAYHHSAATLNYVRAALAAGIADLHRPLNWSLGHVRDPQLKAKYTEAVQFLQDMLRFMHTIGADRSPKLDTVDLFTSHEGLLLEYEESLTRLMEKPVLPEDAGNGSRAAAFAAASASATADDGVPPAAENEYYDTSAHFLWIGDRTRQVDGAHVEFFRGIANPVGIKVGPTTPTADLLALLRALNPSREEGKVTLITRYGAGRVRELLPAHIDAVEGSEYRGRCIWQCDPMHGNTHATASGVKTRRFGDILAELSETLRVHRDRGSYLGGVHLELTGDAVTECLGGSEGLDEDDLSTNYTSFCDPRLNEKQALELAFLVADSFRRERTDLLRR